VMNCPDNYYAGSGETQGYCVPVSCGNRLPLGDEKDCSLVNDTAVFQFELITFIHIKIRRVN
jgi:hypothetical protein